MRPTYRKRLLDPRGRPPGPGPARGDGEHGPAPSPSRAPRLEPPLAPPLGEEEEIYRALVLGTRDYVRKNGFAEVVIGLSGGIDSSLVATIAADALGAGAVHGVSMPSRYTSDASNEDAAELAARLGIDYRTIAIEPAHQAMLSHAGRTTFGGCTLRSGRREHPEPLAGRRSHGACQTSSAGWC